MRSSSRHAGLQALMLIGALAGQAVPAVAPVPGSGKATRQPREQRARRPDDEPRTDTFTAKRKAEKAKRKGNRKGFRA